MTRGVVCLIAALASTPACVLDFDEFRRPAVTADAGARLDAGVDASFDGGIGPVDQPLVAPDATVDDQGPVGDQGDPLCAPPGNSMIRLAHMAAGLGPVDLCMRRDGSDVPYAPVPSNDWPAAGVAYATVSRHFALNSRVTAPNDRWQFVLVPHGLDCALAPASGGASAPLVVTIDPQSQSTLLFTSDYGGEGRLVGRLGLLSDQACTTCPANTLDVRAVHASLAASNERVYLSINYSLAPPNAGRFVNLLFANNISYGQTAAVGGAGFDCDTAWGGAAELPPTYTVQIAAQDVAEDVIARSDRVVLKVDLLLRSRMATVFFLGGDGVRTPGLEFVLCYEGAREAGMTVCDRIPAAAIPRPVAGDGGVAHDATDVTAPTDVPQDDVLL